MLKLKKVAALLVILCILLGIMSVTVSATSNTTLDLNNYLATPSTNETTTNDTETNDTTTGNVTLNTSTGGSVVQPETNSSESENSLPQTGVTEDITVMFFIIVCVVSAIYAYKKIRDYRN